MTYKNKMPHPLTTPSPTHPEVIIGQKVLLRGGDGIHKLRLPEEHLQVAALLELSVPPLPHLPQLGSLCRQLSLALRHCCLVSLGGGRGGHTLAKGLQLLKPTHRKCCTYTYCTMYVHNYAINSNMQPTRRQSSVSRLSSLSTYSSARDSGFSSWRSQCFPTFFSIPYTRVNFFFKYKIKRTIPTFLSFS